MFYLFLLMLVGFALSYTHIIKHGVFGLFATFKDG